MSEHAELLALLKKFRVTQERRPPIYRSLQDGFTALLETGDMKAYSQVTENAKKEFADVSNEIRSVEETLKEKYPSSLVPAMIRELQMLEKSYLILTSRIQILRKDHKDHEDHYSGYEQAEYERSLEELRLELFATMQQINDKLEEIRHEEMELLQL